MPFLRATWLGIALIVSSIQPIFAETIREAVERSVANSDAWKIALISIEAQNKKVSISQSERGISVELFGELSLEQVDNSLLSNWSENGETQFARQIAAVATYPLYDGLSSLNALYREATLLDAAIIRLSDATEAIALNAVKAYIDVFRRQNIVTTSQENIDVHTRIAAQVERLVDAGKLSEPDRFQANDKLLAARLAHAGAKASLNDAISNYQFVIGSPPKGVLSVGSDAKLPKNRATTEANAVKNSFLIQLAQKDIDAFSFQEVVDAADWKPRVDLFARGGVEKDLEGTPGSESTVAAGVRFKWTLYKGGAKADTIARSRDFTMRSHYRKKQVEDEVRDLARKSWNSYAAAAERKLLLDTTVFNNQKIVASFIREFEAAKRPLLQILDAERALFNLKVQRANAEAAVAFQGYRILAAQSILSRHFGLSAYGRSLDPDFAMRVKASPRGEFNITASPLE
jgi:adhesin transport system outer membrane protein